MSKHTDLFPSFPSPPEYDIPPYRQPEIMTTRNVFVVFETSPNLPEPIAAAAGDSNVGNMIPTIRVVGVYDSESKAMTAYRQIDPTHRPQVVRSPYHTSTNIPVMTYTNPMPGPTLGPPFGLQGF